MVKVLPMPGPRLAAVMRPPWASVRALAMASPIPAPPCPRVAGDADTIEAFEHMWQMLGRDTRAAVGDRDGELAGVRRRFDLDVTLWRSVA